MANIDINGNILLQVEKLIKLMVKFINAKDGFQLHLEKLNWLNDIFSIIFGKY